ncbi:MAG: alpha/beta fold hydrolase [bacterium]|nr:alpha/beta fold hydrolase [bacterium]
MQQILAALLLLGTIGAATRNGVPPVVPPSGYVSTHDVRLAYWRYGAPSNATPVIAVNGGPGLSHIYMMQNDVWLRIAREREVVLYDQRGTGRSTTIRSGASQSMAAQVADLDALRAHLGFAKFDLVGDSFGGMIAIAYAAAHPEHVAKLVISDGVPSWNGIVHLLPDVFPDVEANDAAAMKRLGENSDAAAQRSLRDHFRMIFYSPELRDRYLANAPNLGYTPAVGEAVGKATASLNLTSALPKFRFPTLVINGRYDMNVAPLTAWRMYNAIPGARIVFFEKSSHLPSYEEPDRYVNVLDDFFSEREQP